MFIPKRINLETEQKICQMYKDGKSGFEIARSTNIHSSTVYRVLKKYQIGIRSDREQALKYKVDEMYFKNIDTEEKAYWLGFIYADGYLTRQGKNGTKMLGIALAQKDLLHLEKIKTALNATYPINSYFTKKQSFKEDLEYCRILITNNILCDHLIDKGVVFKKSNVLLPPPSKHINDKNILHFIRGYLDGNGSINYYINKHGHKCFEIGICGTREIVLWILKALDKDNLKIHQRHKSNINNWQVNIGGNIQVLKILNALYSDTSIYLERKYKKYLELQDYMKK